jgi:hypothetical protein
MSDENIKEYKLVEDKLKEMQGLFNRMDKDENLYLLDPYKMPKLDGSGDEKDVANVTLNDPLLYATKAIAITGSYQRQTIVNSEDLSDSKTSKIEEFLEDVFYMVNEWLIKRGIISLDAFISEQIHLRGRIAARCCIRFDKEGGLIPDILPLDARWFLYDTSPDGMTWVAPVSTRSKAKIQAEYGELPNLKDTNQVIDFWDAKKNIVFIEKTIAREQPNPYKCPPSVISICPIGSMFGTDKALEHQGESIFWPNRDIWQEKNRTATILQTLNIKSLRGPMQYETEHPETAKKPDGSPYAMDSVSVVEKGGGYRPMPINDIKNATQLFYSILETCLQRGELTPLDYGTLTFPLSSVAILNLIAARNDIFVPRLSAIALFYQSLSRMIIDQCVASGKSIKVGRPGNYRTYSPSDFGGEYSIEYQFSLMSKEQTAADISLAKASQGLLSDDYIRREIIKVDNPDGMKAEIESEQAEKTDEVLFLYRRASSLISEAKKKSEPERTQLQMEAYILGQRIVTILKQRNAMGGLSPIEGKQPAETKGTPVLPLMPQGGTGAKGTPRQPQEVQNA